jgi:hypothetical protein
MLSKPMQRGRGAARQVLVMLRMPPPHFRPDSSYGGGYADDGTRAARRREASAGAVAHGLRLVDDWPMPAIGIDCFVMEDPGGAPLERVLDALARDPRVAWAQPSTCTAGWTTPTAAIPAAGAAGRARPGAWPSCTAPAPDAR